MLFAVFTALTSFLAPPNAGMWVSYNDGYCGVTSAYEASVNHMLVIDPRECPAGVFKPYGTAWIYPRTAGQAVHAAAR